MSYPFQISGLSFPNGDRGTDTCNTSVGSTATMGSGGDFDTDYAVGDIDKSSTGSGCGAWDYGGATNATKGPTESDFTVGSTTAFTLAGWFYLNAVTQTHSLIGFYGGLTGKHWTAARILADNKLQAWSANNGVSTVETIKTTNTVSVSTWHHFAFIHNGTTHTIYLDANTGSKGTGTGDGGSSGAGNWALAGGWGNGVAIPTTPFLDGRLQKVALWDTALTEANITTLYNSGTPVKPNVSENNVKGYWNFNQTTGAALNRAV